MARTDMNIWMLKRDKEIRDQGAPLNPDNLEFDHDSMDYYDRTKTRRDLYAMRHKKAFLYGRKRR